MQLVLTILSDAVWLLGFICIAALAAVTFSAARPRWLRGFAPPFGDGVFSFEGRVVLVTGAGSGVGRSLATKLYTGIGVRSRPQTLVLLDINEKALNDLELSLKDEDAGDDTPEVVVVQCDISDSAHITKALQKVKRHVAPKAVSVVVNNAGILGGKPFLETSVASFHKVMDVNCVGPFTILRELLGELVKQNDGLLVSVGSVMSLQGGARLVDYCSSKWAFLGLHESLRMEIIKLGATNIRTLFVAPYVIDTGMFKGSYDVSWGIGHRLSSFLFPMLKTEQVAERVLSAMEYGETFVTIPFIFRIGAHVAHVFPTQLMDGLSAFFGGTHGMDGYVGRQPQKSKTS